jgi:hypothetical protein
MHEKVSFLSCVLKLGGCAKALALCLSNIAAAQPATEVTSTAGLQRISRVIAVFEIARSHAQKWESNVAAQTLVSAMMDDLVRETRLDINWKARLLLVEDDRSRQEPDAFEQNAIETLGSTEEQSKQVWNADRDRVVSVVRAHKSCMNCHDVTEGDTIGYVSLTIVADH